MQISPRLENHLGKMYNNQQADKQLRNELVNCPPVHPALIRHLEFMFSDPGKSADPTHPMLSQLLVIQYGCDKVLKYLKNQYNMQSEAARKEHEI